MPVFTIKGTSHTVYGQEILDCLPSGTELYLIPEPENKFDKNAIKVTIKLETILKMPLFNREKLADKLQRRQTHLPVLEWIELGYIAKEQAVTARTYLDEVAKFVIITNDKKNPYGVKL